MRRHGRKWDFQQVDHHPQDFQQSTLNHRWAPPLRYPHIAKSFEHHLLPSGGEREHNLRESILAVPENRSGSISWYLYALHSVLFLVSRPCVKPETGKRNSPALKYCEKSRSVCRSFPCPVCGSGLLKTYPARVKKILRCMTQKSAEKLALEHSLFRNRAHLCSSAEQCSRKCCILRVVPMVAPITTHNGC